MSQSCGTFRHKLLTQQQAGEIRESYSLSTFTIFFLPPKTLSVHIRYHFGEVPEPALCSVDKKAGNKHFVHSHGSGRWIVLGPCHKLASLGSRL